MTQEHIRLAIEVLTSNKTIKSFELIITIIPEFQYKIGYSILKKYLMI